MWTITNYCKPNTETPQQTYFMYILPEKKEESAESRALAEALECCRNQELGVEEASAIYGIPKRTLRAKLKNKNFSVIDEKYKVFVLPVFPAEAESDLVDLLQNFVISQITYTSEDVRRLGYEMACFKYNVNSPPPDKNCLLGRRWYKRFISKYPYLDEEHIRQKYSQNKSAKFFNVLENLIANYEINVSRIFFVGGVELKFRASSSDDFKIFEERKTLYTEAKAICCTSPNGIFIPPIFLQPQEKHNVRLNKNFTGLMDVDKVLNLDGDKISFNSTKPNLGNFCDKLKKMCDSSVKNLPRVEDLSLIQKQIKAYFNKKHRRMTEENEEELREKLYELYCQLKNKIISNYENSLNHISHEIFYEWLESFIEYVNPSPQEKVLLLLSDQNYVKYFKTLDLGKSSGVQFLAVPPHPNHKIHPLDGFTMSLNRNLSTCARRWLGKNSGLNVNEAPLQSLFRKAYADTINPTIAKNGFLYSGIWPINRFIFQSAEFGGKSILMRKVAQSVFGRSYPQQAFKTESLNEFSLPLVANECDLQKFCRICMKEKMYMKPLFGPPPLRELNYHGKKLSEFINIPLVSGDGLPEHYCQYCHVQLTDVIRVRAIATESYNKQTKLRESLGVYFGAEESSDGVLDTFFQTEEGQLDPVKRTWSKNFDMDSMCRICTEEKPLMTCIFFKTQDGISYCTDTCRKIFEVTQCQIDVQDGLSTFICPFCRASINQGSEFIDKAVNSDKRFREIVAQIKN